LNASPLIALGRIDALSLLPALATEIAVPEAVRREVEAPGPRDPAFIDVSTIDRLRIVHPERIPDLVAAWALGVGESEVIAWAVEHPYFDAVLDDLAARNCARALGLAVQGTLGILVLAKRQGLVPSVGPLVDALIGAGFRAHPDVLRRALALAGEAP
jgi:predicted nucleic acid-binding protein